MRHMGHTEGTAVLRVKGSVCVLQMLSTSHNALQSTLIVCSRSSSFQDNVIPLVRTSYLCKCVDMEGAPSLWNSKTMHSRSAHEGPEQNDAVKLSVALHHVLLSPASRPTVPFGMLGVNGKHHIPSHTGCTAEPKHKSLFPAIVQTESPHGQLSHD